MPLKKDFTRRPLCCTFTATVSPLFRTALCTCAREAEPKGTASKESKMFSSLSPNSSSTTLLTAEKLFSGEASWKTRIVLTYSIGRRYSSRPYFSFILEFSEILAHEKRNVFKQTHMLRQFYVNATILHFFAVVRLNSSNCLFFLCGMCSQVYRATQGGQLSAGVPPTLSCFAPQRASSRIQRDLSCSLQ